MNDIVRELTKEESTAIKKWETEQDESHIEWLSKNCVKGCTGEHLSMEESKIFYEDFVQGLMLYHYPEDSDTLNTIILTYNYLNKWK